MKNDWLPPLKYLPVISDQIVTHHYSVITNCTFIVKLFNDTIRCNTMNVLQYKTTTTINEVRCNYDTIRNNTIRYIRCDTIQRYHCTYCVSPRIVPQHISYIRCMVWCYGDPVLGVHVTITKNRKTISALYPVKN